MHNPPHAKNWLIGKDSDAGRDWGQEEKGTTEDEMAGWHHWLDGRESEWTPGVGDGQGGLACCDSWGRKESDTTERLIWSDLIIENILRPLTKGWIISAEWISRMLLVRSRYLLTWFHCFGMWLTDSNLRLQKWPSAYIFPEYDDRLLDILSTKGWGLCSLPVNLSGFCDQ